MSKIYIAAFFKRGPYHNEQDKTLSQPPSLVISRSKVAQQTCDPKTLLPSKMEFNQLESENFFAFNFPQNKHA